MRRQLIGALMLALASFGIASAQETTTGTITGTVQDAQGAAVPGATVSINSNQGVKTFVTDSQGHFFAPFLTPGRYAVKVELTGFSPVEQKNIDVRLGQRVELRALTLKVGGLEEVVEVVGSAPVVDTHSTTTGGILESDSMRRLPVGRNFTDTLYLVPGVSASGLPGSNANPSIGGASGLENNYVIDGVNITSMGYGAVGSYSIVLGSLGNGVTTDFIKETQVKTGGFEAEYGQSTGGVVSVVTQSGSNAFHGSVYGYLRPDALESSYDQLTTANGTVNLTGRQDSDFGITLGGPIVKDKVFFFGAFNPQFQRVTGIAPANFPLASIGETDRTRRILSYAGKVSWQAGSNHRFDATAFGDPGHSDNGPQRANALLGGADQGRFSELKKYGGHNQVIKYDGIITRNWLVEASAARAKNDIEELPALNDYSFTDATVTPTRRYGGVGAYELNSGTNKQYSLKSTNIFNGGGNHQIRYGVGYEDINYLQGNLRTGAPFTLPNGVETSSGGSISIFNDASSPSGHLYRVTRANFGPGRQTTAKYLNMFLQDTWQIGKRLTLRPGVRYEEQKLVGNLSEYKFDGNYAPRIGATYDLSGNGKSKLYGSWGRFYAKIPNDLAARALSADASVSRVDYFDAALTQPVPEGRATTGGGPTTRHFILVGQAPSDVDPNAKSTYQDEIVGGFEWQVLNNVNFGVRYIHRTMPRILEDVGTAQFVAYDLGLPGLASVEYFITNPSASTATTVFPGLQPARFEDVEHKYDAVEVTANKAFSDNWSMLASYRWSRLKGNFEGFYRNDNGQSDPAISSLFDFPTNDPTYTSIGVPQFGYSGDVRYLGCTLGCGVLPNDRTQQLKIYTNRSIGAFNLGLGINAGSGQPLTRFAANPNYSSPGEIPETVRGAGIQTVDGFRERAQIDMQVDLHADYTLKLADRHFVLSADAFNLFDRQSARNYDNCTEQAFGQPNPNYGQPTNGCAASSRGLQAPLAVRVGARFEW